MAIKTFGCSGPPLDPSPSVPAAPAGTGRHRSRAGHRTVLCTVVITLGREAHFEPEGL